MDGSRKGSTIQTDNSSITLKYTRIFEPLVRKVVQRNKISKQDEANSRESSQDINTRRDSNTRRESNTRRTSGMIRMLGDKVKEVKNEEEEDEEEVNDFVKPLGVPRRRSQRA